MARQVKDPLVPTVFHEPWWLDAASGGQYEEVTVSSGGRTLGRLPFVRRKRLGFTICEPPETTHFLGPAVDEGSGSSESRALRRAEITLELIEKLPSFDHFHQWLHRGIPDALPFVQHGFTVEAVFTYEVAPGPEQAIWRNMRDKTRNVIRRAQEQTELVDLDPGGFSALYDANLQRKGQSFNKMIKSNSHSVFEAALSRGRGRLLAARDEAGTLLAAIFYAWDESVTYYMLTTRAPGTHNGVVSRLIWEAMRESAAHGRIFDLGGIGTSGSVLFYIGFGGEVRTRYVVERMNPVYGAMRSSLLKSREVVRRLRDGRSHREPEP